VQDKGDVVGLREAGRRTGFRGNSRRDFEDGDAEFGGYKAHRGVDAFLDDQELGAEVFEEEGEFGAAVTGVEGGADSGAGDAQEGGRHFGAVGEDDGDTIGAGDPGGAETIDDRPYLLCKLGVRKRCPAGGMDRGSV
jgi:hypothetical protein